MQQEVFIRFGAEQEIVVPLGASEGMSNEQARRWLDEQFIANECEPLRASGKVLTGDKLVAIAEAAGAKRFAEDAEFRHGFAQAAVAATGKSVVRVDLEVGRVSF